MTHFLSFKELDKIDETDKALVFGYVRQISRNEQTIPNLVMFIVLSFWCPQDYFADELLKQVDRNLYTYYIVAGHGDDYLNDDGIGKFMEWVEENGYSIDQLQDEVLNIGCDEDESLLLEFEQDDFPFPSNFSYNYFRYSILSQCFESPNLDKLHFEKYFNTLPRCMCFILNIISQ